MALYTYLQDLEGSAVVSHPLKELLCMQEPQTAQPRPHSPISSSLEGQETSKEKATGPLDDFSSFYPNDLTWLHVKLVEVPSSSEGQASACYAYATCNWEKF